MPSVFDVFQLGRVQTHHLGEGCSLTEQTCPRSEQRQMFRWPNACKELNSACVFIDIRLTWLEWWYQMPGEKGVTCCRTSSITSAWCRSTTGTIRGRSGHRPTWILSLPPPSNGTLSQGSGEPVGSATNVELVAAPHLHNHNGLLAYSPCCYTSRFVPSTRQPSTSRGHAVFSLHDDPLIVEPTYVGTSGRCWWRSGIPSRQMMEFTIYIIYIIYIIYMGKWS